MRSFVRALAVVSALACISLTASCRLIPFVHSNPPEAAGVPRGNTNNVWFRHNDSDTVYVFVHGLLSDSRKCWMNEQNGAYWPDLVANDPRLEDPSIYLAGYYTEVDSGEYRLSDCAEEVYQRLIYPRAEDGVSAMDKKNIVFVCHSLGCIVTQEMLTRHADAFESHNVGLMLFAAPSHGAKTADNLEWLSRIYQNDLAKQLARNDGDLLDLNTRFTQLVESKRLPRLWGMEAVENQSIFHMKGLPPLNPLVPVESAGNYFGTPIMLPRSDHSNIATPRDVNDGAHMLLVNFMTYVFGNSGHNNNNDSEGDSNILAGDIPAKFVAGELISR